MRVPEEGRPLSEDVVDVLLTVRIPKPRASAPGEVTLGDLQADV